MDGWSNAVWNQVFCGDPGAARRKVSRVTPVTAAGLTPTRLLATCPVTEQEPYLYTNSAGAYNVFVPSLQTNSSGTTLDEHRATRRGRRCR